MSTGPGVALMLHDVLDDGEDPDASGFPGAAAGHYKIDRSLLEALVERPAAAKVVLTFDDGGRSAARVIAPVLEQRGVRGTFLITTSKIGSPGFVDVDDLRHLASSGHVIGTHSHTHPERMAALSYEQMVSEWRTSTEILEEALGRRVTTASVPNGYASGAVVRAAAAAGIRVLYTSVPVAGARERNGVHVVGRFAVLGSGDRQRVVDLLDGRRSPRLRQQARWFGLAGPKRILGPAYPVAHARIHGLLAARAR